MLWFASEVYAGHPVGQDRTLILASATDIFISSAEDKETVLSGDDNNRGETELNKLLEIVSKKGLKALDLAQLDLLRTLLEAKSYADKKANKSKEKLLKQINTAFYDRSNPRRLF
jgi:hypothetical protein